LRLLLWDLVGWLMELEPVSGMYRACRSTLLPSWRRAVLGSVVQILPSIPPQVALPPAGQGAWRDATLRRDCHSIMPMTSAMRSSWPAKGRLQATGVV